ncbi:hypothetical protein [Paracoccus nototheniae]|uniref:hypothetical protein n=1 Tax=Paracoccus nototheniae TaxID=2489002 RepID=UPI0013F4B46E|nr:hypothetical protein [Paracoccus nototheniae]
MPFLEDVNLFLRDHMGYTGDGQGGNGALPVGDRSTSRKPINTRDLRALFAAFAEEYEGAVDDAIEAAVDAQAAADLAAGYAGSATGTPQFASRATAEAATIPAFANWIIVGGLVYRRSPGATALTTAGGVTWAHVDTTEGIDTRQFGASMLNDDNSPAIQAAIEVAKAAFGASGAAIILPAGGFVMCRSQIDAYRPNSPRSDLIFKGAGHLICRLTCGFYGADLALIRCRDPLGVTRSSPIWFENVRFQHESTTGGVNPVFLDIGGWGNSSMYGILFSNSNNTQLRASSIQNLRMTRCEFWYGGYAFPKKSTSGITFSLSGTTLTASGAIFDSRDRYITIFHSPDRRRYRIAAYVSPTEVTLEAAGYRITSGTGLNGLFDCPRVSMVAGSNLVNGIVGDEIFVAGDVGRTILIPRAREGNVAGAFRILRARIIEYVAPHAVRIGDEQGNPINADRDVTHVRVGCPAIDFYQPRGGGSYGSLQSDLTADHLHIEHFAGVGIFAETADSWRISGKIHGDTNPSRLRYSLNTMWFNNIGGEYVGGFDSTSASGEALAYIADQAKAFTYRNLWARNAINERIVQAEDFLSPSGYVIIDGIDCQNYAGDPRDLISETNVPFRVLLLGFVNMQGDSQAGELRFGHGSYIDHRHLKVQPGRVLLGQAVDAGSLPNGSFGINVVSGNLVFRDMAGVLRTINTTVV